MGHRKGLFVLVRVVGLLMIFSFLSPIIHLGSFGLKPDLIFLFPLLLLVLLLDDNYKKQSFFLRVFLITFLVFVSMLISGSLGNRYYLNLEGVYFPTEFISFISKVCVLYIFYVIGKHNVIPGDLFLNAVTCVFLVSLVFGFLQILGFSFAMGLTELYASTENQVYKISGGISRVFSVTGNVLTWAGWSGFILIFSSIVYRNITLKVTMIILAAANLIFTSSRGAIIAMVAALLFYFIFNVYKTKKIRIFAKYILISVLSFFIIGWLSLYFFKDRIEFFVERFYFLDEAIFESGRGEQLENIKQVFDKDVWNYLFGLGKPVVDSIGLMEIEFIFILFAYGLVGICLQYSFVYLVLKKAVRANLDTYGKTIFVGIVFYLVYSSGYFFLREIYSGLLFWTIIGYFLSKVSYEK